MSDVTLSRRRRLIARIRGLAAPAPAGSRHMRRYMAGTITARRYLKLTRRDARRAVRADLARSADARRSRAVGA